MRSVGLALGGAVAIVATLAVVLLREPGPRVEPDASRRDAGSGAGAEARTGDPAASAGSDDRGEAARASEPTSDAAATNGTGELGEYRGEGSIKLKIVDDATGGPLADLPFVVYSERPRLHVYTRGVSDERGEATIGELPEDVVIFETPRRPPHANAICATWLSPRQRKRVEMRVGRGGTVRGRVVDDVGTPLRDVEVVIDPRPGNANVAEMAPVQAVDPETARRFSFTPQIVATSGADGRFEIPALLSRVAAIWIEHGAMSPKREEPFRLVARAGYCTQRADVTVHEGETSDVGDLVLPRSARLVGRVVDEDGAPLSGALISTRGERYVQLGRRILESPPLGWTRGADSFARPDPTDFWLRPGEAGFALARGESLSGGDGGFEVEIQRGALLLAATADARRQWFPPPPTEPGSRVEGVELKFEARTLLRLDVRDPDGRPLPDRSRRGNWELRVGVQAEAIDGRSLRGDTARIDTTTWGVELFTAPATLRSLTVTADDFEPAEVAFASPPPLGGRFEATLTPIALHPLRLRFTFADAEDWKRLYAGGGAIHVSAGPRPDPSGETALASGSVSPKAPHDCVLQMRSEREWFVVAEGPFDPASATYVPHPLGAFRPGETVREFTLPAVSAEWVAVKAHEGKEYEEREKARREAPKHGTIVVRAIDAVTRTAIRVEDVLLRGDGPEDHDTTYWPGGGGIEHGVARFGARPGRYRLAVSAVGHRAAAPIDFEVVSEQTCDLGEVALEPFPAWRLKLLSATAEPLPDRLFVVARARADEAASSGDAPHLAPVAADGSATLRCDLPERFLLDVGPDLRERFATGNAIAVRLAIDRWSADEVREFALAPWRDVRVVVDLSAVDADLREARSWVQFMPLSADGAAPAPIAANGMTRGNRRHVDYRAPPGRYRLELRGVLFGSAPTPVEVLDQAERQEFTLVAR